MTKYPAVITAIRIQLWVRRRISRTANAALTPPAAVMTGASSPSNVGWPSTRPAIVATTSSASRLSNRAATMSAANAIGMRAEGLSVAAITLATRRTPNTRSKISEKLRASS